MTISEFINKVGFKVNETDVQKVNNTISGIKNTATKLLGAIGIGVSLTAINALAEEFGAVNDSIKSAIGDLDNMDQIQKQILDGANDARTSYGDMANTVSNLVKSSPGMFPTDEAIQFSSNVTKLLKTAGRSEQTIAGVIEGLNKSFQKGIVDTETLNVLLERSPEAANLLAKHLGVAKSQLETMASDGRMQVNDLKDAFLSATDEINEGFKNVDMRVSDALRNIRNQWGLWIAQTDKTLKISNTIAKVMTSAFNNVIAVLNKVRTAVVWLSEKLGGTEKLMKLVAIVGSSILIAFQFDKIKAGLQIFTTLLKGIQLKTLAIVAVIVLLALLVEDFINFMNGNDSLIGSFLEKAGINTDEVRESFVGLGEQFKELIALVKELGSALLDALVTVLGVVLELLMNLIVSILPVIIDLLNTLIPVFIEIVQMILPAIISLINELVPVFQQIIQAILPIFISLIKAIIPLFIQIVEAILPFVIQLLEGFITVVMKIITAVLPVFIELINLIIPLLLQLIESILPIIIDLINRLLPLILSIIETILPIIIELIQTLIPFIVEIIEAILPVIIQLLREILPIIFQIIETILPVIIELITMLVSIVMQIVQSILPVIIDLIKAILPLFLQIIQAILPVIINLVKQLLPILTPIIELIATLAETLLPIIVTILNAIIPIIETIAKVLAPVFDLLGLIINAIGKVVGWVADGLGWIVDLFFGGDGASSKAKDIAAYAGGTDNSDDTFIAGEEGPELITGSRGKKVFTALETGNIFENLGALAAAKRVSSGTAAAITNTSEVRKSVVQNVNITNEFNGDRAIQENASSAMEDSANDVTSELARGLAFVG